MAAQFQTFFPFLPDYMDWTSYNGNLVMYYGQEPIPYSSEDDWAVTANSMTQLPVFASYPIPDPSQFDSWQDWARQFSLIVNGPPK